MKLLLDENLAARLVRELADLYPASGHVTGVGLAGASDDAVWRYAATHGYVLASKDEDFLRRSVLDGPPPKVICIRLGNCPTAAIAQPYATTTKISSAL
ncbi:MAG TPA: DUF5615 family PIN-like protein [Gemmatimonadaceae bacterium]|nr:DUF5615 family PIN-like protein [Gemmatimonadaceae bacterium]